MGRLLGRECSGFNGFFVLGAWGVIKCLSGRMMKESYEGTVVMVRGWWVLVWFLEGEKDVRLRVELLGGEAGGRSRFKRRSSGFSWVVWVLFRFFCFVCWLLFIFRVEVFRRGVI